MTRSAEALAERRRAPAGSWGRSPESRVAAIDVALGLRPGTWRWSALRWWTCTAEVSTGATWRSRMTGSPWSVTSLRRSVPHACCRCLGVGADAGPGHPALPPVAQQSQSHHCRPVPAATGHDRICRRVLRARDRGRSGGGAAARRGVSGNAAEADPARPDPCLCAESRGRVPAGPGEPRYRRSPGDAGLADLPRAGGDLLRRAVRPSKPRSAAARTGLPRPRPGQGRDRPRGRAGVACTARGLGGRRNHQ